jgi:hypothetical protein
MDQRPTTADNHPSSKTARPRANGRVWPEKKNKGPIGKKEMKKTLDTAGAVRDEPLK